MGSHGVSVAIFDVDGTLIEDNIGTTFVKFLNRRKKIQFFTKLKILFLFSLYKLKFLTFKHAIICGVLALAGRDVGESKRDAASCFKKEIVDKIYSEARSHINKLKSEGYKVILATGAHELIANELGRELNADHVIATVGLVEGEKYSGKFSTPLPYEEGKARLVSDLVDRLYPDREITVYTDEKKDIPLLVLGDKVVAVNADSEVTDYVESRGGEVIKFQ